MRLDKYESKEKYQSYLYVFRIKSPTCETEYIKIGKTTKNLMERFSALSTGSPYVLNVHMTFRFKEKISAALYEIDLHKKMEKFLVKGEWFIYNEDSKKHLILCASKIKNRHFDIRKYLLPRTLVIPNIDYAVGESLFINKPKERK